MKEYSENLIEFQCGMNSSKERRQKEWTGIDSSRERRKR